MNPQTIADEVIINLKAKRLDCVRGYYDVSGVIRQVVAEAVSDAMSRAGYNFEDYYCSTGHDHDLCPRKACYAARKCAYFSDPIRGRVTRRPE